MELFRIQSKELDKVGIIKTNFIIIDMLNEDIGSHRYYIVNLLSRLKEPLVKSSNAKIWGVKNYRSLLEFFQSFNFEIKEVTEEKDIKSIYNILYYISDNNNYINYNKIAMFDYFQKEILSKQVIKKK